MSKPTVLSPWFVVTKLEYHASEPCRQTWWTSQAEEEDSWTDDRKFAMLFNSLHSAHRVARAGGGYVVAVVDEEDWKEYR